MPLGDIKDFESTIFFTTCDKPQKATIYKLKACQWEKFLQCCKLLDIKFTLISHKDTRDVEITQGDINKLDKIIELVF